MNKPVQSVAVIGAGSAGFLSAVAIKRLLPQLKVTVLRSEKVPVIGVGESTTAFVPTFLHQKLGLDRKQFYAAVRPVWKMGLRLEWGSPRDPHFNYSFDGHLGNQIPFLRQRTAFYCLDDWTDSGHFSALMDRCMSPLVLEQGHYHLQEGLGYHIDNRLFLDYLQSKAHEFGATVATGDVVDVVRSETGDVAHLQLEDGQQIQADLFVDCSGFSSLLLGKTIGERFVNYGESLFCDRAVLGSWDRADTIEPFTGVETMDHGWCWRIGFENHVNRGYVYSSAFCDDDQAEAELRRKNPLLGDDLKLLKFPSGRYENFWSRNVVGIGNASAFVEPLESTALHLIGQQLMLFCGALQDAGCRVLPELQQIENRHFRQYWDEVRDFLALHYKFNQKLDTPFWRHCREKTPLGDAQPLVDLYQRCGPVRACGACIPRTSMFEYSGYMALLVGQRLPIETRCEMTEADWQAWEQVRNRIRSDITSVLPVRQALSVVNSPQWRWPETGV